MPIQRKDPSPYIRRGDRERRRARWRAVALAAGGLAALALVLVQPGPDSAAAADAPFFLSRAGFRVREERDVARSELEHANAQLARLQRVFGYSNRYAIPAGLAAAIYDAAAATGLDADLAFRLVKAESDFNERAVSRVGAVGLTQLMPATASAIEPGVTRDRLFRRDVNLRIGFTYLRGLIAEADGDVATALLVYNRGPAAVAAARARGENPSNGYDRVVMRGYRGRGVVD
ncbi:MAG: transglycosylase SLT domain-containing protein [Gemmatimonadota bacterium]